MQSQDLDKAFEALKTYDWGTDRKKMDPIDEAVIATRGDADARKALEKRLAAVLGTGASRSAKDYVCRTLKTMGTAESVPALAALLPDQDLSHMARYALERIPAPEAADALRAALPSLPAKLKAGVAGSLGVRRDEASVPALAALLNDSDPAVVSNAACALGSIGTPEAAKVLGPAAKHAPQAVKSAVADACLVCAEQLLAGGKKADAIALYKSLTGDPRKQVNLAAKRGLLSAMGKKD
jgi:HEAT repeat protein